MDSNDEQSLAWDQLYRHDPDEGADAPSKGRKSRALASIALLLTGSIFFLKGTFAGNISLGATQVEFGQGVQTYSACAGSTPLTLTPIAAFSNQSGAGAFYFKSFSVSNIPASCNGTSFTLNAYDSVTASALALFDSSSKEVVVYDDNGSFMSASGSSISVSTNSSSSFTVTLNSPVALSSLVSRVTLQSAVGAPPYNYNSILFTSSTYMTMSPGISPGAGAFTIETWIKTGSSIHGGDILGNSNNTGGLSFILDNSTTAHIDGYNIGAYSYTLPITLQPSTWYHIAISRNGSGAETVWINGQRSSTGVLNDTINYSSVATGINWAHCTWCVAGTSKFNGERMSSLRVVVGSAVYDPNIANFIVPTMPLGNIANTKLLLNFSNAGSITVDSSGNQVLTNNGVTFVSGQ